MLINRGGATPPAQMFPQASEEEQVRQALEAAIAAEKESTLALLLYDTGIEDIEISSDGNWATAWLVPLDPDTGQVVPSEPGLAIARKVDGVWEAYLPADPRWTLAIQEIPDELVSPETKTAWMRVADFAPAAAAVTFSGYYLPWAGGDSMNLTQSVGHDRYTPSGSAHFSFDFAKSGWPSGMFNVHAAKGGTVRRAVWSHPNGDPANGNYLVLEDTTTSPTSYQLYLHLAQNSIPPELRTIGTYVRQGQLIGVADDTGISSGNHLHFMVHTNATSYWGTSVDITFVEVSINGGRPRIQSDLPLCKSTDVCDSVQTSYVSRNFMNPDFTPPAGGISAPPLGAAVTTQLAKIIAWARDDNSGIAAAQIQARFNNQWRPIGASFNTADYTLDWDMCSAQAPEGPISLALNVADKAGNRTPDLNGLTHFIKSYACPPPPPACVPGASQVALFSGSDYQGSCIVLNAGSYTSPASLGSLGDNNVASIQVGANVHATLYMNSNLQGRAETFKANDSNLSDNRVGADTTSSLLVRTRSTSPAAPLLVSPANSTSLPAGASFTLSWYDAGGGYDFQARLLQSGREVFSFPWQNQTAWHLSGLPAGSYTWQARARNAAAEGSWSSERSLTITAAAQSPSTPIGVPYTDTMETTGGWTHSGAWALSDQFNHTPDGTIAWKYTPSGNTTSYDTGAPNSGYLTSPPVTLPAGTSQYLRFWYRYDTESPWTFWDQRWVQISVDGGPFMNVLQLWDDAPGIWLRSPAIALGGYAGKTVQVRFYFATLDSVLNAYQGWNIDDFAITAEAPPACADSNDSPGQATVVAYNQPIEAQVCPGGDVDYYRLQGAAGERIGVRVDAQVLGSPLDTYLFLLDSDGSSILAQNDDQLQYEHTDSFVTYQLPRDGAYFIKVRSWDHPTSGGPEFVYTLTVAKDDQPPIAHFSLPQNGGMLPSGNFQATVSAMDTFSGVSHVQFYWHSPDWLNGGWEYLGEDWNGLDGWSIPFDASKKLSISNSAFYAQVFDWSGNSAGTGAWNLRSPGIFLPFIRK